MKLLPSWWYWFCSGWWSGRAEAPHKGQSCSWKDRTSPAGRGARPASSVASPACFSAPTLRNARMQEQTAGWAWRNSFFNQTKTQCDKHDAFPSQTGILRFLNQLFCVVLIYVLVDNTSLHTDHTQNSEMCFTCVCSTLASLFLFSALS